MSLEALNKIFKEVQALTPDERRQLIERLAAEEQHFEERHERRPGSLKGTVKYMAPDFDDTDLSHLNTHGETITADSLREWLDNARNMRAELPMTSDSVNILRDLREVRARQ